MAQSAEDASAEEIGLQYFCHHCDQIVTAIEYANDGTIKCKICNEQYVEIMEQEEEEDVANNNNQSNINNPNNNNNNTQYRNANGQFFYFSNNSNAYGQPIQVNFGANMNNNAANMPNIGQIINQSFQNIASNLNNNNNNNNVQQQRIRINQGLNQGLSQGMNMMFNMNNMSGGGGVGQGFNNMIQQMVAPSYNGPPPASNNTISHLPEYQYDGHEANESNDANTNSSNEDKDNDLIQMVTDEGNIEDIIQGNEVKEEHESKQDENEEIDAKNRECAICKDKFCKGEILKELPCNHRYHKDCIMPWLLRRNTCPTCRHRLPSDNAFYDQMENARESAQNNNSGNNNNNNNNGMPGFNLFFNQFFAPNANNNNANNNNANNNNQ